MEQTYFSETDPPEIRRRLQQIQGQRALIEDLATRLKAAELEYDRMEIELNEYRASIAPIRKCPDEVLLMIFESFSQAAPELVAVLLQVCKRWRDIAANTPRLWTHIHIKIEPIWDQCEAAQEDAAMIETYLRHSASLPLHINLDLSDMLDEESQVEGFLGGLYSNGCNNQICRDARRFVAKLDRDASDTVACFSKSYGPKHVSATIDELVGRKGIHMGRWKSLHISLPCDGWGVSEIWKLLSGRTPQLTELLISWESSQLSSEPGPVSFADLSSLEDLTLEGVVKDFNFLGLTFPSVKRLGLEMSISHCSQLSRFTSLEHLDVLFYGTSAADAVKAIHLPLLRDLTFHLVVPTTVEWHVPVLQRLEIVGPYHNLVTQLPDVQALEVEWRVGNMGYKAKHEPKLQRTLQAMMSQYRDMQKLTVQALLRPIWENYTQQLSGEKRLDLPTVAFY